MKPKLPLRLAAILLALSTLNPQLSTCLAQGTGFTYQGRLNDGASPASGIYDLRFTIYDSSGGSGVVAGPLTNSAVAVSNGLFTVTLDPGAGVFTGAERWLEIAVRTNGGGSFVTLSPRQKFTATPYAITSGNISGTLANTALPTGGNWPLTSTLTLDTSTLAIDPTLNRVGIGTSTPPVPLTVATGIGYGIEHTDGTRRMSTYLDENGCWLGSVSPDKLLFFVNNGGSSMSLDLAGRLGLGTDAPAQKLHLFGLESRLRLESSGSDRYAVTEYKTDARAWHVGVGASGVLNGLNGKYYLWDDSAAAVRMAVDTSGNVGFGTATPEWPLHVKAAQSVARLDSTASTYGSVLELRNNAFLPAFLGTINFNNAFNTFPGQIGCTGDGALTFRAGSVERMRILPDGEVGIGTSAPTQALHVERPQAAVLISSSNNLGSQLILSNSQSGAGPLYGSILMQNKDSTNSIRITGLGGGLSDLIFEVDAAWVLQMTKHYALFRRKVHVEEDNEAALSVKRKFSDGTLVSFSGNYSSSEKGSISLAGETVSYNAFTGSHYAWTDHRLRRGELVRMTGDNRRFDDRPGNEIVYGVAPTTQADDPACLGAYLSLHEPVLPAGATNPHLVMAVGNGELWVVEAGGDIEPGDGLISSDIAGCSMKDDPARFGVGYVVARAAERVRWAEEPPTADGVKRRLISVLFGPYVRGNLETGIGRVATADSAALAAIQGLNQKLEAKNARLEKAVAELKELVEALAERVNGGAR